MQANQEASKNTDLKANPEEMKSEAEHWEVPKECVAVKPVGGLRKQHRGQKLAARQCREPKELTRGDCGVTWHKRNSVRNKWTRAKNE
jgi:hypothetical protein